MKPSGSKAKHYLVPLQAVRELAQNVFWRISRNPPLYKSVTYDDIKMSALNVRLVLALGSTSRPGMILPGQEQVKG
jgi:hypothetical protein